MGENRLVRNVCIKDESYYLIETSTAWNIKKMVKYWPFWRNKHLEEKRVIRMISLPRDHWVNLNDIRIQIESILCLLLSDCNECRVFPNILFLASWTARIGRFFRKSIYFLSVTSIGRTRPSVIPSARQEGWNLIKMSTINGQNRKPIKITKQSLFTFFRKNETTSPYLL